MILSQDPLVLRSRFIASLPNDPDMRLKFNDKLITVFVTSQEKAKLIPSIFDNFVVRVICILGH